jgi:CBS domain-containing protein
MQHNVVSITPDAPVSGAARLLSQYNIGALPVCTEDGRLRGVVTDRDIVTRCVAVEEDPQTMQVKEVMTRACVSVSPGDELMEAVRRMTDKQIRRLPVIEKSGLISGILSLSDIARSAAFKTEAADALAEFPDSFRYR